MCLFLMRTVKWRAGLFGRTFMLLALLLLAGLLVWLHVLENTLSDAHITTLNELAMSHGQTLNDVSQDAVAADPTSWRSWLAGALLLALFGAALAVAYLNRPLSELAQAARRVSEGSFDVLLPECGPQELCDLSAEFNQMARRLQIAEADRTLLLAGLAHDLRAPLARLRLEIELSDMKPGQIDFIEQDLGMIDQTLDRLLDYARPCKPAPTIPIDLRDSASKLIERYTRRYESDRLFWSDMALEPVFVRMETEDLERCLVNLLDNARIHGRSIDTHTSIHVSLHTQLDSVWINVSDEGPGLTGQNPADWLKPFYRGKGVSKSTPGTGLGLASVNRIVANAGGTLQILNRAEGGLTARLILPRVTIKL